MQQRSVRSTLGHDDDDMEERMKMFREFLKAVMMRVKPLVLVPQLSVWYLSVTKLVLVMMNPLLPTDLGSESQLMWAWEQKINIL